jgi:hypothetical protein
MQSEKTKGGWTRLFSLLPIPNPNPLEIETGLKQKKKLVQFQFWLHLEIGPKVKFQKINQVELGESSTPNSKLRP